MAQLADEVGSVIDIPTFHIFGCDDAFLSSAVALFNVCRPDVAHMYDHGLGHIVPRDAENVGLLGNILQELLPKFEEASRKKAALDALVSRPRFVRTGSETDEGEQIGMMGGKSGGGVGVSGGGAFPLPCSGTE